MGTHEIETLILEDGIDDTDNMKLLFQEDGEMGKHTFYSNSKPFLEKARSLKYAVLVLDYKLSEGPTGIDVLREINEDDEDELFYTIIQTGYPSVPVMLGFIKLRPNDFVIKGDGQDHYLELIRTIKKGKRRIERRLRKEQERQGMLDKLMKMAEAFGNNQPMKNNGRD